MGVAGARWILSHRELVGIGIAAVRRWDRAARKDVSLGWLGDLSGGAVPSRALRCVAIATVLSRAELCGAGYRAGGAWVHLQQVSGQTEAMALARTVRPEPHV